jgi:hypothetical protein
MRLPQSFAQPFSTRVLSIITTTIFVSMLPLCARAATRQLTCAPSSLRFGSVLIGQTETQVVVLTNGGETSVTVSAMSSTTTEFTLSGITLPLTLPPGQSTALNVTFAPIATGGTGGEATFTSNASNPNLQLQLAGAGVKSDPVTASPSIASFGNVAVGASSTLAATLTNHRSSNVTLSSVQTTGNGFSLSGPAFPITLGGGQSLTLSVTFAPQSAGASGGSVFVTGPGLVIPLTGTGTTLGQLTITPSLLNFGDVPEGTTQTEPITMSAAGASVTVFSDSSSNSQFVLDGASLPFTIPAGQSLSLNVGFTPQGSGTVTGSLSFTSNASNSVDVESLTGIGTVTNYRVSLWWNASTGVVGYNVYRSTAATGTYAKINSTLDANTAYTDSTVVAGNTYYYEATSVNSSGQESTPSTPPVQAVVP